MINVTSVICILQNRVMPELRAMQKNFETENSGKINYKSNI